MEGEQRREGRWDLPRVLRRPAVLTAAGLAAVAGIVVLSVWYDRATWDDDELEDAVHAAASALEAYPHLLPGPDVPDRAAEAAVRDAIVARRGARTPSGGVHVKRYSSRHGLYDIRADGVAESDDVLCLRIRPPDPPREGPFDDRSRVRVREGRCEPPVPLPSWAVSPSPRPSATAPEPVPEKGPG
ncbi:hypothetical protein CUT44_23870 [Streptomyces carminius]|uniref:Uncharacterized protein n=1 Tax=Streptomyces carminius TaxID=2665496 RepID=A0A2M8LTP4_9ACTN|nr:hypothetical protein [Streptomyces carminius]PJE95332.1 hypothetical protein CUT44_23870 [Streptomyces carminius]